MEKLNPKVSRIKKKKKPQKTKNKKNKGEKKRVGGIEQKAQG